MPLHCPSCGAFDGLATVECVQGTCIFTIGEDGKAQHMGKTDIDWGSQFSIKSDAGDYLVHCTSCGYEWLTPLTFD